MFRRTVATVINEQASLNLASELLGPSPANRLDRFRHERILDAVHRVQGPERRLGRSRGIG